MRPRSGARARSSARRTRWSATCCGAAGRGTTGGPAWPRARRTVRVRLFCDGFFVRFEARKRLKNSSLSLSLPFKKKKIRPTRNGVRLGLENRRARVRPARPLGLRQRRELPPDGAGDCFGELGREPLRRRAGELILVPPPVSPFLRFSVFVWLSRPPFLVFCVTPFRSFILQE